MLAVAGLTLSLSCRAQEFNCQDTDDCGADGQCQPSGYCSFPDNECPSGQRYGDLAGAGLAGECVNPTAGTDSMTTTSDVSTATATTTATTTTTATGSTSTGVDDDSTSTGAAASTSTGDVSDTSTGDPGEPYSFFDDFDRTDSDDIGNGWVEDNPPVFSLFGGEVVIDELASLSYERNLVYRPLSESIADVEAVAAVRFNSELQSGTPQVFARVQPDVRSREGASAYLCFYTNSGYVQLRRNNVAVETDLAQSGMPVPYNLGDEYRLRLRVEGADPVQLLCALDVLMGERWSELASVMTTDDDAEALVEAGSVGFSTNVGTQPYRYDDFYVVDVSSDP